MVGAVAVTWPTLSDGQPWAQAVLAALAALAGLFAPIIVERLASDRNRGTTEDWQPPETSRTREGQLEVVPDSVGWRGSHLANISAPAGESVADTERLRRWVRGLHQAVGCPTVDAIKAISGVAAQAAARMDRGGRVDLETIELYVSACLRYGQRIGWGTSDQSTMLVALGLRPDPLAERESDVDSCLRRLKQFAKDRQGGLIVIDGPAGIGKSELWRRVRAAALILGLPVAAAVGSEGPTRHVEWSMLAQLFGRRIDQMTEQQLESVFAGRADLARIPFRRKDSRQEPEREILDALLIMLERIAGTGLAIAVDDVQWADEMSVRWLGHIAPNLSSLPVTVVLARRIGDGPGPNDPVLDTLGPVAAHVRPRELSPIAVKQCARTHFSQWWQGIVDKTFLDACYDQVGGLPYSLHELLNEAQQIRLPPIAENMSALRALTPHRVTQSVAKRLEVLGPDARRVAQAAAVVDGGVSIAQAAAMTGLSVQKVTSELDRLITARILSPAPVLRLAHPLTRSAVYQQIPAGERSNLHHEAARLYTAKPTEAELAAAHLLSTLASGDPWTVEVLRAGAHAAIRSGASETAARYLQRALQEPPPLPQRPATRLEYGQALALRRPHAAIEPLLEAFHETADEPLRVTAALTLAKTYAHADQMGNCARLLASAIDGCQDAGLRRRLEAEQFLWSAFWIDEPDSHRRSTRLAAIAAATTATDNTSKTIRVLHGWDLLLRSQPRQQCLAAIEDIDLASLTFTDPGSGFDIPTLIAFIAMFSGKLRTARDVFVNAAAELTAAGWTGTHLAFTQAHLANIALRQGLLAEAEADARIALRLAYRVGRTVPAAWYAAGPLLQTLMARGNTTEATRLAADHGYGQQQPNAFILPVPQVVYGRLLCMADHAEHAAPLLRAAGRWLDSKNITNPEVASWRLDLATVVHATDHDEAMELALTAQQHATEFGAPHQRGLACLCLASLTSGEESTEHCRQAVAILARTPHRHAYAQALQQLGLRTLHNGDTSAIAILQRTVELADQCQANQLATQTRKSLVSNNVTVVSRPAWTRLTAEEIHAIRWFATGKTTADIAQHMLLAQQAVERLIGAAQSKLDINYPHDLPGPVPQQPPPSFWEP